MAHLEPLEHLLRFWRALDDLFEAVEPAWWGAVVSDARFPSIWDVNYARVETGVPDLTLAEVEGTLRPALARTGARNVHLVLFHPGELTGLLSDAGMRGDRLTWDTVMEYRGNGSPPDGGVAVEEPLRFDTAFWARHRESLREFDIHDEATMDQLVTLEREVMIPAGKRWFTVSEGREVVAYGSLLLLEGIGYVDHVVTFPAARRKGYASAVVSRIAAESAGAGAERLYLLAEPRGGATGLYERLGFAEVGKLASTLRPMG
ncbi:MAG: GNAT family N-acetyltransferase [Actinobacteria bacterium]|nr:GNAT family N-acetyltransferase [Actinomycetota bacterium]